MVGTWRLSMDGKNPYGRVARYEVLPRNGHNHFAAG